MKTMTRVILAVVPLLLACGAPSTDEGDELTFRAASTADLGYYWQPFSQDSVWNLKLSPTRSETPIPAAALASGNMAASDAAYGIKVYFAKSTDPVWKVSCGAANSWLDVWLNPCQLSIRIPAGATPPTGDDGTVFVVDENQRYAYEMWRFKVTGTNTAYATGADTVDLRSNGIHRNVGVTAAGLPGIGGVLKSYETRNNVTIRHKIWVAANAAMLYAQAVWPASRYDATSNGASATLRYGDVIALSKSVDINNCGCNLSPFMKRIAKALQDYGGIVQDRGGDALGFVSEVNSIRDAIDIDYNTTMWTQFGCLKKFMVKVNDPWSGATPGGLGFNATADTAGPTAPAGLSASAQGSGAVQLDWVDSSDNVGVAGYAVYRDGTLIAKIAASQFSDSNLAAQTRYSYYVRAYDAAGNQSAASATATATTAGPAQDAPELLANAGFEAGASPWLLQQWDGAPQVRICTDRARSGARSFCITNGKGADGAATHPYISVSAGARYQASAWLYVQGVSTGAAVLMIDWYDGSGRYLGSAQSGGRTQNTTSWTQESLSTTAPAGAQKALLFLFSWAAGTVYYDDVSMKRLP